MPEITPRLAGLRPAPAWLPPARFWLSWPKPTGDRAVDDEAQEDCLGLATLLSDLAPVSIVCPHAAVTEVALRTPPNVAAFGTEIPCGPLRLQAPLWLVDDHDRLTAAVASTPLGREMAEKAGVPILNAPQALPPVVESDGEGTALVPAGFDQALAAEQLLHDWLGFTRTIWLGCPDPAGVVPGARFLAPSLLVLSPQPATHQVLDSASDAKGRRFTLVELPDPKKAVGNYGDCLITGDTVVVPDFEDGLGVDAADRVDAALNGQRKVGVFPATWLVSQGCGLGGLVVAQPAV